MTDNRIPRAPGKLSDKIQTVNAGLFKRFGNVNRVNAGFKIQYLVRSLNGGVTGVLIYKSIPA